MDMMTLRRAVIAQGTGGLPSAYRLVEYLESTGTQWILTSIVPDNFTCTEAWVTSTTTTQDIPIFGVYVEDTRSTGSSFNHWYHITPYSQRWYFGTGGAEKNAGTYTPAIGEDYHVVYNDANHGIVINGTRITGENQYTFASVQNSPLGISIRGHTLGTSKRIGQWRYKKFCVYNNQNGTLYANLLPCVRKADSKPGMYDTISKTFYTNAGTGEFITNDTSPKILQSGVRYRSGGTLESDADCSITAIYNIPTRNGNNRQATVYGIKPSTINYTDGVYLDYWNQTQVQSPGLITIFTAGANQVAFTLLTSMINDSYVILSDGTIMFAGKNSIYYGHRNISELD